MKHVALLLALSLLAVLPVSAQEAKMAPRPEVPTARPSDVESLDAILRSLYDVISGPAGPRDWARFRSLFAPEARMGAAGARPDGTVGARVGPVEDYIERSGAFFLKEGFHEREIGRHVDTFGPITHVFSAYEARHATTDEKPFVRGINSIQLYNDGKRWHIVSVFWTAETEKNPIPAQYVGKP